MTSILSIAPASVRYCHLFGIKTGLSQSELAKSHECSHESAAAGSTSSVAAEPLPFVRMHGALWPTKERAVANSQSSRSLASALLLNQTCACAGVPDTAAEPNQRFASGRRYNMQAMSNASGADTTTGLDMSFALYASCAFTSRCRPTCLVASWPTRGTAVS